MTSTLDWSGYMRITTYKEIVMAEFLDAYIKPQLSAQIMNLYLHSSTLRTHCFFSKHVEVLRYMGAACHRYGQVVRNCQMVQGTVNIGVK